MDGGGGASADPAASGAVSEVLRHEAVEVALIAMGLPEVSSGNPDLDATIAAFNSHMRRWTADLAEATFEAADDARRLEEER